MKRKSITVIIPAYNSEDTIEVCIQSVQRQSKSQLIDKIIVINDGSKDKTDKVVESAQKNSSIKIELINQKNSGVSAARNKGIKNAKSEWVAFLDSDDIWLDNKLEIQEAIIDKHQPDMVAGTISQKKQKTSFFKKEKIAFVKAKNMLIRSFPQTSTVMIRRDILKNNFVFDINQSHCEDMNLFTKIAYYYKFVFINQQMVVYGNGKPQIGNKVGLSSNIKKMNDGAIKNIKDFYKLGIINFFEYIFFQSFNYLKYIRRKIIARIRKFI